MADSSQKNICKPTVVRLSTTTVERKKERICKPKQKREFKKRKSSKRKSKHKKSSERKAIESEEFCVDDTNFSPQYVSFEGSKINAMPHVDKSAGHFQDYPNFNFSSESPIENNELLSVLWQKAQYLEDKVLSLTEENLSLKKALYNVKQYSSNDDGPEIDVAFKNSAVAERFMPDVSNFLVNLLSTNLTGQKFRNNRQTVKDTRQVDVPNTSNENANLFMLDNCALSEQESFDFIPKYETSYHEILREQKQDKEKCNNSIRSIGKKCYNCSGDHFINACPFKIDPNKVRDNRRTKTYSVQSKRYHVHGGKESCFKPGTISEDLQKGLGLKSNQIPLFIYNMRVLGYPPGWLMEAAVESSGITLYDTDGKVEISGEKPMHGEIDQNNVTVQYDPDKFVDYQGFNVPLPPDYIDESQLLGFPSLQPHHLRSYVEMHMEKPDVKPSRKRKLEVGKTSNKTPRLEEDMEVVELEDGRILDEDSADFQVEFIPPLPQDCLADPPPPPPPPPPPELSNPPSLNDSEILDENPSLPSCPDSPDESNVFIVDSAVERFKVQNPDSSTPGKSSPSLRELEEMKKKLMMELSFSLDANDSADEEGCETPPLVSHPSVPLSAFVSLDTSNDLPSVSDSSLSSERTEPKKCNSLSVALGTPSLSRHSSFTKLPEYEKFSKNVSSHLPFENLPNSTGTYQRMKGVLKKVKKKLNSLMK